MQQVDHYLRQAKAARDLAARAGSEAARVQFELIAATWELLAKERLSLLELRTEVQGAGAELPG